MSKASRFTFYEGSVVAVSRHAKILGDFKLWNSLCQLFYYEILSLQNYGATEIVTICHSAATLPLPFA